MLTLVKWAVPKSFKSTFMDSPFSYLKMSLMISVPCGGFSRAWPQSPRRAKKVCSCGYSSQTSCAIFFAQLVVCGVFSSCTCRFAFGAENIAIPAGVAPFHYNHLTYKTSTLRYNLALKRIQLNRHFL